MPLILTKFQNLVKIKGTIFQNSEDSEDSLLEMDTLAVIADNLAKVVLEVLI